MKKRRSLLLAIIAGLTLSGCEFLGFKFPDFFGPGDEPEDEEIHVESVSLSESNISLDVGESKDLTYTVLPENANNKEVIWSINDENVASVLDGHVVAKNKGSAFITLKSVDGEKSATCGVTVNEKIVSVTGVGLNKTTLSLNVGESETLVATVAPSNATNKDVTWNSSDSTVVSVSGGQLTAKKAGNAVITVETVEGNKVATCNVSVTTPVIPVTGITISKSSLSLDVGKTAILVASVEPENATNQNVTWTSTTTSVATVNNGVVTAKAKGNTTIKVRSQDGGFSKTCVVTVTDSQEIDTITPDEAVDIIKGLDSGVVSSKEYYVRGVTVNVEMDSNGFNGGFVGSALKFRSVQGNGFAEEVDDIAGKEVIIHGYLEFYNNIYQIPFLPAYASPTGSKYNAKITYVESGGEQENIDATNISVSPVNKTINVNEKATLIATILPENATNKTVTWTSSNSSVCTVSSSGEITGVSQGIAVITAKTHNNLTATCTVTVQKESVTPVTGDKIKITFNNYGVDGQSELNEDTLLEQVTEGIDYIKSVDEISKVYKGISGLKFGSQYSRGNLEISLADSVKNRLCKEIDVETKVYGTKSTTVTIGANGYDVKQGSSSDSKITGVLSTAKNIDSISISTTSRAYVLSITLILESSTPIPVTAISVPSSKTISVGNSETIAVTYTPNNANTGKTITWTSSNTDVATVSNGVVTGVAPGTAVITAKSEGGLTAICTVTVSNISVTSVSLSLTSETLNVGSTKQLTETVLPANATNKNVTWSSSNSSVAEVSTKGLVTAKAVGTAIITVKTVDGNKQATCTINIQESSKDKWTIMIYMCGADLESENGLATSDIREILSVNNQPENVNILIETGGAKSWSLNSTYLSGATKIDPSKLSRWHVENKKLVLDETLTYASMGSSSTLQSFVEWGIKEYPAEKTGVIFWNHGGAMYGCCYDEKKNDDSLVNSEMKTAFSKALANTGSSKLEFVGYDTCLTQVQDIAEFNSNYFNYMIASEEAESGYGWDYDTWVDDLYANKSTETILKAIVDGFITDNGGASSARSDQTLSFLDLNQMPAYKTAFESFASALKTQLENKKVTYKTFASWMSSNVKSFAADEYNSEAYYCLFDVKDMINKISNSSTYNPGSNYISAMNTAFSNLVKYSVAQKGAGNAYGLGCIYCQASSYSDDIASVYTSTETNFSNWLSFLKTYSYLA